jgi:hypothetical protein
MSTLLHQSLNNLTKSFSLCAKTIVGQTRANGQTEWSTDSLEWYLAEERREGGHS